MCCGAWLCRRAEEGGLASRTREATAHVRPAGLFCSSSTISVGGVRDAAHHLGSGGLGAEIIGLLLLLAVCTACARSLWLCRHSRRTRCSPWRWGNFMASLLLPAPSLVPTIAVHGPTIAQQTE